PTPTRRLPRGLPPRSTTVSACRQRSPGTTRWAGRITSTRGIRLPGCCERTPPPNPLPEAERGGKAKALLLPLPETGGGLGGGVMEGKVTAEEFGLWVQRPENRNRWFELVRGVVIELSPPVKAHGRVCMNVAFVLETYVRQRRKGYVTTNDAGVILERG